MYVFWKTHNQQHNPNRYKPGVAVDLEILPADTNPNARHTNKAAHCSTIYTSFRPVAGQDFVMLGHVHELEYSDGFDL